MRGDGASRAGAKEGAGNLVATTLCQPQVPSATPSMGANRAEEPPARGQPGSAMRLCQNQETGPCTGTPVHSQRVRCLATKTLGAGNLVATTLCQSRVPSAAPSKKADTEPRVESRNPFSLCQVSESDKGENA